MSARSLAWAGVLFLFSTASAGAQSECGLREHVICSKLHASVRLQCIKHVQLAMGACRKAYRKERFGSHEDHCRAACKTGRVMVVLGQRLSDDAVTTAMLSAGNNAGWLKQARQFWRQPDDVAAKTCNRKELQAAKADCEQQCATKAARRDLEELQGLAAGKDFLALQPPVFACAPSAAAKLLSRDGTSLLEQLYPPGHPRRTGSAAQ